MHIIMDMENISWFAEQSELYSKQLLPNTVIQQITGVFGILGNIIVLLMYTRYIHDTKGTRYFIPILALVDLAGCISNVTKFQLEDTMRYFYANLWLCRALQFFMVLFGILSALMIFVIALQRYLLICRPLGPQMTIKRRRLTCLIAFVLAFGGAATSTPFIEVDVYKVENASAPAICMFGTPSVRTFYYGGLCVWTIITIIGTFCLYIPVIRRINKRFYFKNRNCPEISTTETVMTVNTVSLENIKSSSVHPITAAVNETPSKTTAQESTREKHTRKISIMFLVIIIVYVVSFIPPLITSVITAIYGIPDEGYRLNFYFIFIRFNLLNHISNPYIYWFFDINFREKLKKLFSFGHFC